MEILRRIAAMREAMEDCRRQGRRIAFVPTMGNLHEGHLSLLEEARRHGDCVVASIFVNPLQFGAGEDFRSYPRTPQQDLEQLRDAGAAYSFLPAVEELYPHGIATHLRIVIPELDGILEGAARPGHFGGVAAVVAKLLLIVNPHCAVFGLKDLQQLHVIRALVRDLCLPLAIIEAPTVRGADGLALSSRNRYLSTAQRRLAAQLYRQLCETGEALSRDPAAAQELCEEALRRLRKAGFQPDYFCLRDAQTLAPLRRDAPHGVLLGAVSLGNTRLIDNVTVPLHCKTV